MFVSRCLSRSGGGGWLKQVHRHNVARYSTDFANKVGVIGVPFDRGQKINTKFHEGPKAIRDGGLVTELTSFNGKLQTNCISKIKVNLKYW